MEIPGQVENWLCQQLNVGNRLHPQQVVEEFTDLFILAPHQGCYSCALRQLSCGIVDCLSGDDRLGIVAKDISAEEVLSSL